MRGTPPQREVARTLGINLLDIERYKRVFDSYDKNKSGVIEQPGSFGSCGLVLLGAVTRIPAPMMCHVSNRQAGRVSLDGEPLAEGIAF